MLYDHSDTVAAFVAGLIPGCERGFGECQAIGFLDGSGALIAGVVYHKWSPESGVIEISAASIKRNWLTRKRMAAILEYPFSFCRLIVTRTEESNTAARHIWRSLGADEYVIPRLWSPTEAQVIYTLSPDQWDCSKFKDRKHGPI